MLADGDVHIPHLASIETASTIRGVLRGRQIDLWQAELAMVNLADLAAERHAHEVFLPRIWALRHNLSAYDAAYVALAEALDSPLLTCDARLARAPLTGVTIELMTS
jgi:predicted nucleic acid-binding protein